MRYAWAICLGLGFLIILVMGLFAYLGFVEEETWVNFSASPNGKVHILFRYSKFGDAGVYLAGSGNDTRRILGIAFRDCNERVSKFAWSRDSTKLAFLISNSNRYAYGNRLMVFDLQNFPKDVALELDVEKDNVVDFELHDEEITYWLAVPKREVIHKFRVTTP